MDHFTTPDFWDGYQGLPKEIQELADKNYALLRTDPNHPSLHLSLYRGFNTSYLPISVAGLSARG